MNTTLTKSGTIPQNGLDRVKYIRKLIEIAVNFPSRKIDIGYRNGDFIRTAEAADCTWDWTNLDYALHEEEPKKIQLRLPMYIKYRPDTISVVTSLFPSAQSLVVGGGTWHLKDIGKDSQYSHDGTNWQPFTGNEVI